jgi:hypothetical protein
MKIQIKNIVWENKELVEHLVNVEELGFNSRFPIIIEYNKEKLIYEGVIKTDDTFLQNMYGEWAIIRKIYVLEIRCPVCDKLLYISEAPNIDNATLTIHDCKQKRTIDEINKNTILPDYIKSITTSILKFLTTLK